MAWLKRWWVVVCVVVVIVVGGIVAFQFDDEKNKIAIYAAIVGTSSLLLTGEKHVRDRLKEDRELQQKEDDKRVVLTATAQYTWYLTGEPQIGVELYNAGKTVVPIKHVRFVVDNGNQQESVTMDCTDFKKTVHMRDGPMTVPDHRTRVELEPKKHVRFHVDSMGRRLNADAVLQLPPDTVYIVVESFTTPEVVRVPGSEIQDAIRKAKDEAQARKQKKG